MEPLLRDCFILHDEIHNKRLVTQTLDPLHDIKQRAYFKDPSSTKIFGPKNALNTTYGLSSTSNWPRSSSQQKVLPDRSTSFQDEKIQSDDEDYEEDYDSDDNLSFEYDERPIKMSANLMRVLGIAAPDTVEEIDWKPPPKSGLDNSNRIIDQKSRPLSPFRVTPLPANIGSDGEKVDDEDDNGEDSDDDGDFLSDSDTDFDERPIEMSANLKRLLGIETQAMVVAIDWKAPDK